MLLLLLHNFTHNNKQVVRETSDKRNELETYIYAMRDRIGSGGDLEKYASQSEAAALTDKLGAAEEW
jgi:heat shock 70kDa protein 4